MRTKKAKQKIKVGSFVRAKHKQYSRYYEGVVTESFDELIQIYGAGWSEDLGYHELELDEYRITPIEKDKVRFVFDQEMRNFQLNVLKAEIKFNEEKTRLDEATEKRNQFFGQ